MITLLRHGGANHHMKIEYLLIKSNNDFCSSVEQFKSLLCSNKRVFLTADEIKFSGTSIAYTLTSQEVTWKKNKEVVFYFTVEGENPKKLEELDALLHRINDNCGNQFMINTIWDDVSIHYTNKLYPEMVQVENLLRKLIYRFMIKTAGSAWFGDTTPEAVKEAIKNTAGKNRMEELPTEDQLYLADFIQLGLFFFENYTTKPFGQDVIKRLKEASTSTESAGENLRSEIVALIETYEAKSNWDRYFADKIEVDDLYEK